MPEHTSILNLILESIFIGFGFVIPIVALLRTSDLTKLKFKDLFILTAVQAVRVGGIISFIFFLIQTYIRYTQPPADLWEARTQGMIFSSSWIYYWYAPSVNFVLTQLWWINRLIFKKAALVILSLMLLILPSFTSEQFIILITSLHRDYLPSTWSMYPSDMIIGFALNIIVFIFIVFTIMLAGNKFKKIKE